MKHNLILVILMTLGTPIFAQKKASNLEIFETVWKAYRDHYAFFDSSTIDWDEQYRTYRERITTETTEREVFELLKAMITPLDDSHSYILKGDSLVFSNPHHCELEDDFPDRNLRDSLWAITRQTLQKEGFGKIKGVGPIEKGTHLFYTSSADSLGYIRISRCYGRSEALFDEDLVKMDSLRSTSLFDSLLIQMLDKKGMIIDLRNNHGGNTWCYHLASRFLDQMRTTYLLSHRTPDGHEPFSAPSSYSMTPHPEPRYKGRVILLTNGHTASAAEGFILVMKELPQVTMVGSRTMGIFSNTMNYPIDETQDLWGTLSDQRKYDVHGTCFEKVGIPADVEGKNTRQDLVDRQDPMIFLALSHLGVSTRK
ncbi:MAG: S41 family peptidase [Bacteroidota bacterium]|nr:S41 family peptidase [Bacteroidota bacterium]